MRVLVACEFSGVVSQAFREIGHEAVSCDLLPSRLGEGPHHYQGDVRDILYDGWDLLIAHPPCTSLCVSGNRYYANTQERLDAVEFFRLFLDAPIKRICVENPVGVISTYIRPPDQYIQPWQFGHGETKKTGLWLKNLSPLVPTKVVEGREQRIWKMAPSPMRGYLRSITYQGIAEAMAKQWGFLDLSREGKVARFLEAAGKRPLQKGDPYEWSYENNLKEEVAELVEAMMIYHADRTNKETRANLCKEWADVQVVLSNIAVWLDIPADAAFNRVHNNNMTKVVDGKLRFRKDGKVLKPDGYVKPDMTGL